MRRLILSGIILLVYMCTVSCNPDEKAVPVNKDRTVLVYMLGNNSIGDFGDVNLEAIKSGYTGQGNLLIYIDQPSVSKLIRLKHSDSIQGKVEEELIRNYGDRNSATPKVMNAVIEEVRENYPAESYGLILWSHGTAWLPSDGNTKAFGQDGSNWLEITDLAQAIPDRLFDCILFDACYMASVEVAYELSNKCNYMIAAPTEVWDLGFPYAKIINKMWGNESDYKELCRDFFDFYQDRTDGRNSATISLIKMEEMEALAFAAKTIIAAHKDTIESLNLDDIQLLGRNGSLYWNNVLFDLEDYLNHLDTEGNMTNFRNQLKQVVISHFYTDNFWNKLKIHTCCGLNCYIPQKVHPGLNEFYKTTRWYQTVYGED